MTQLFLDDVRDPPAGDESVIVRSFAEAVEYVERHGIPAFISFDHDLGENVPTGHDFATHQSAIKTTFLLYKATVSAIGVG